MIWNKLNHNVNNVTTCCVKFKTLNKRVVYSRNIGIIRLSWSRDTIRGMSTGRTYMANVQVKHWAKAFTGHNPVCNGAWYVPKHIVVYIANTPYITHFVEFNFRLNVSHVTHGRNTTFQILPKNRIIRYCFIEHRLSTKLRIPTLVGKKFAVLR